MALGLEQCIYCGADFGTDVDHFDPIARSPLRADGRPLLIDPTSEGPFEHMTLSLSTDVYHPLSGKGIATIDVCGLNRGQLKDGR